MSASLTVDLSNTCQIQTTIAPTVASAPASGAAVVGQIVDLIHANSYCNLLVGGGPSSGVFFVSVQTSDTTTSGSFTDPTSGIPTGSLPTNFLSGAILVCNSGLIGSGTYGGPNGGVVNNAPLFCSGAQQGAAFLRNARYARAIALSGSFDAPIDVKFVSALKTTGGSGAWGSTFSPGSGTVSV